MLRGEYRIGTIPFDQVAGRSISRKNPPLFAATLKHFPNLRLQRRTQLQSRPHLLRIPESFMADSGSRYILHSCSLISTSFLFLHWLTFDLVPEKTKEKKLKSGFVNDGTFDLVAFLFLLLPFLAANWNPFEQYVITRFLN